MIKVKEYSSFGVGSRQLFLATAQLQYPPESLRAANQK